MSWHRDPPSKFLSPQAASKQLHFKVEGFYMEGFLNHESLSLRSRHDVCLLQPDETPVRGIISIKGYYYCIPSRLLLDEHPPSALVEA